MKLRKYQQESVDSVFSYFKHNKTGNCLVVLPTGAGKSLVIAEVCKQGCAKFARLRVLILAHRKELLVQNAEKLVQAWPAAPIGIYSAGLKKKQFNRITVAGIQSIYSKTSDLGWQDLVIIDEAHLIPKKGSGQYRTLIEGIKRFNPKVRILGLTATPFRVDSGVLTADEDSIFNDICYEAEIRQLILDGYLSNLVSKQATAQANLEDIRTRGGEYVPGDVERAVDKDDLIEATLDEICSQGVNRKKWLIFCASVRHAHHVNEALNARGISCCAVTGETPSGERDEILRNFREGSLRAVTNCDVLTTGFDSPNIDLIALLRPTKSIGLYIQMVGRGLRLSPGKENCLILDHAGNIERHGPIDSIKLKQSKGGKMENSGMPTRVCPECGTALMISIKACTECGFEFPIPLAHVSTASEAPILSVIEEFDVSQVEYRLHQKDGKPDMMRVIYTVGYNLEINQFWCFDHASNASMFARRNWVIATGNKHGIPATTKEALQREDELGRPVKIFARKKGKYYDVLDVKWDTSVDKYGEVTADRDRGLPF